MGLRRYRHEKVDDFALAVLNCQRKHCFGSGRGLTIAIVKEGKQTLAAKAAAKQGLEAGLIVE